MYMHSVERVYFENVYKDKMGDELRITFMLGTHGAARMMGHN